MKDGNDSWSTFTRRTNDPKLAWVEARLTEIGVPSRREGRSFHAPILKVPTPLLALAWTVLENPVAKSLIGDADLTVDDLPDDHPMFLYTPAYDNADGDDFDPREMPLRPTPESSSVGSYGLTRFGGVAVAVVRFKTTDAYYRYFALDRETLYEIENEVPQPGEKWSIGKAVHRLLVRPAKADNLTCERFDESVGRWKPVPPRKSGGKG